MGLCLSFVYQQKKYSSQCSQCSQLKLNTVFHVLVVFISIFCCVLFVAGVLSEFVQMSLPTHEYFWWRDENCLNTVFRFNRSFFLCVFSRFRSEQVHTGVYFPMISKIFMTICFYVVVVFYFDKKSEISLQHVITRIGFALKDINVPKMVTKSHFSKFKSLRFSYNFTWIFLFVR